MRKKSDWKFILALVAVSLLAAACTQAGSPGTSVDEPAFVKNAQGYTDITVEQLKPMLRDKGFTLVNVHIPYDGDLPQTDLTIPYNEIGQHLDKLPDKDARIVVYCRSGSMSTAAAAELAALIM